MTQLHPQKLEGRKLCNQCARWVCAGGVYKREEESNPEGRGPRTDDRQHASETEDTRKGAREPKSNARAQPPPVPHGARRAWAPRSLLTAHGRRGPQPGVSSSACPRAASGPRCGLRHGPATSHQAAWTDGEQREPMENIGSRLFSILFCVSPLRPACRNYCILRCMRIYLENGQARMP